MVWIQILTGIFLNIPTNNPWCESSFFGFLGEEKKEINYYYYYYLWV
jgi:hypothetical protein